MKLRYLVIVLIASIPIGALCDLIKNPIAERITDTILYLDGLLFQVIIIWSIVKVIKYFIRYYVKYSAKYNAEETDTTMDDINAELDEIEASLDRVRASEEPDSKVTAIWSRPKKK